MNRILMTGITFSVFMAEALIHYNMGTAKSNGQFRLRIAAGEGTCENRRRDRDLFRYQRGADRYPAATHQVVCLNH